jgi:hypothetical protein
MNSLSEVAIDQEDVAAEGELGDRLQLAHLVRKLLVHPGIDGVSAVSGHQHRIAVGVGVRTHLESDDAAGTAAVVRNDLLPEVLPQFRPHEARQEVARPTRHERDDEPDRLAGIRFGRDRRGRGQCRKYACECYGCMLHRSPPRYWTISVRLLLRRVGCSSRSRLASRYHSDSETLRCHGAPVWVWRGNVVRTIWARQAARTPLHAASALVARDQRPQAAPDKGSAGCE